MGQGGAKLELYVSLTCALRIVQVGVESDLGQVPLHGALRVSRGACSSTALKYSVNNHAPNHHSSKSLTRARTLIGKHSHTQRASSTSTGVSWGYVKYTLKCARHRVRQLCHGARYHSNTLRKIPIPFASTSHISSSPVVVLCVEVEVRKVGAHRVSAGGTSGSPSHSSNFSCKRTRI